MDTTGSVYGQSTGAGDGNPTDLVAVYDADIHNRGIASKHPDSFSIRVVPTLATEGSDQHTTVMYGRKEQIGAIEKEPEEVLSFQRELASVSDDAAGKIFSQSSKAVSAQAEIFENDSGLVISVVTEDHHQQDAAEWTDLSKSVAYNTGPTEQNQAKKKKKKKKKNKKGSRGTNADDSREPSNVTAGTNYSRAPGSHGRQTDTEGGWI